MEPPILLALLGFSLFGLLGSAIVWKTRHKSPYDGPLSASFWRALGFIWVAQTAAEGISAFAGNGVALFRWVGEHPGVYLFVYVVLAPALAAVGAKIQWMSAPPQSLNIGSARSSEESKSR